MPLQRHGPAYLQDLDQRDDAGVAGSDRLVFDGLFQVQGRRIGMDDGQGADHVFGCGGNGDAKAETAGKGEQEGQQGQRPAERPDCRETG